MLKTNHATIFITLLLWSSLSSAWEINGTLGRYSYRPFEPIPASLDFKPLHWAGGGSVFEYARRRDTINFAVWLIRAFEKHLPVAIPGILNRVSDVLVDDSLGDAVRDYVTKASGVLRVPAYDIYFALLYLACPREQARNDAQLPIRFLFPTPSFFSRGWPDLLPHTAIPLLDSLRTAIRESDLTPAEKAKLFELAHRAASLPRYVPSRWNFLNYRTGMLSSSLHHVNQRILADWLELGRRDPSLQPKAPHRLLWRNFLALEQTCFHWLLHYVGYSPQPSRTAP